MSTVKVAVVQAASVLFDKAASVNKACALNIFQLKVNYEPQAVVTYGDKPE
jgi:hypothetical protein